MSGLLLPFARHIPTGKTVAPEEVDRGNACDCECLFCGAPVQARHCSSKANHFAHQPKVVDDDHPCPASFERCIFWMTKRILEEGTEISLPEYKLTLVDNWYDLQHEYTITKAQTHPYVLTNFPDISAAKNEQTTITIDIYGHPLHLLMSYERHIIQTKESSVHISLDYLMKMYKEQKQGFLLAMRDLILESTSAKEWLFHSEERYDKCEKHFNGLIEDEKQRRNALLQAQRREVERVIALQQTSLTIRKDPTFPGNATRRLQELVNIAKEAANRSHGSGWQCKSCFVVTCSKPERCVHCESHEFVDFDFSRENMRTIYNKFYCANYGARSLAAAPQLTR